jgi:hypothetical protein
VKVSFIHRAGPEAASYRYRAEIPAREIGAVVNEGDADIYILAKPMIEDLGPSKKAKAKGAAIIVDICDYHIHQPHYQELIELADAVTCSTPYLKMLLDEDCGVEAHVIPDPYEFEERPPHVSGANLLWFGHKSNLYSLQQWLPQLAQYRLVIMSNAEGTLPWSREALQTQLLHADIVLMPETAPYKSPNRTVEAIRSGCFVVAEPHPSLEDIPGIWVGNLLKGVEWAIQNPYTCKQQLIQSQAIVREKYSPALAGNAWRTLLTGLKSNWDAGISPGLDGSTSMASEPESTPILSLT